MRGQKWKIVIDIQDEGSTTLEKTSKIYQQLYNDTGILLIPTDCVEDFDTEIDHELDDVILIVLDRLFLKKPDKNEMRVIIYVKDINDKTD